VQFRLSRDKEPIKPASSSARSLTAAATRVDLKDATSWQMFKLGDRRWQLESWRHYDICGELRFVANWLGQAISRCRMYVAEIDEETGEPGDETQDETASSIGRSIFTGPARRAEAQRLLALNLTVAGEVYIVCEAKDGDTPDVWYTVSTSEIFRTGDTITVRRSMTHGGGKYVLQANKDILIRCWGPHPRVYDASDSTVRAVLPVLREIEQSTKRVFAEIDSRLAGAGVLAIPTEMDFPGEPGDTPSERFSAQLERTMAASLQQHDTAEALVPIVIEVAGEFLGKLQHLTFASPVSETIIGLRKDAITRLAMALDVPPEVLLGMGKSSHWNAWQVEESTIKIHVEPVLIRIADALTTGYLHPALKAMGVKDFERYTVWFDTAPLAVRPNRSDQALQFRDKGLLSDTATRGYGDFPEDDAPTEEETNVIWMRQLVLAAPALIGDPNVQTMLGLPPISMPAPQAPTAPADLSGGQFPEYDADGNPITSEPADAGTKALPQQAVGGSVAASALFIAADAAVRRALELAGGRLVPARDRITRYKDVPRHELHTHVWVDESRLPTLLAGAWEFVSEQVPLLGVESAGLVKLLDGYTKALMINREPHTAELLAGVIMRARQ
jgi:hypothetical protein